MQEIIRRRSLEVGPLIFGEHETKDVNVIADLWRRKLRRLWRMCEWESHPHRTIPTAYYPNQGGRRRHGREFLAITALTTNNHGGRTLAPERYAAISVVPRVVSVPAHPNPRFRRDTTKWIKPMFQKGVLCATGLGSRARSPTGPSMKSKRHTIRQYR